jgi:c-di-GMP-binding flagellar brake protein YcgR
MAVPTVMRRQSQRDLLTQLSARRRQVTVSRLTNDSNGSVHTRVLAVERDGVLLEWPHAGLGDIPESGAMVAVQFEHLGERLSFRVPALGRTTWQATGRGPVTAWRLALPIRIEPVQQRRHFRVNLTHRTPLVAQCTSVEDPTRGFAIHVRNLSGGGLCATADRAHVDQVRTGATFWTRFTLPDEPAPLEFVVRVAHTHDSPTENTLVFGGMFCAGDDPRYHRMQMVRIERFLTGPHVSQPTAASSVSGKGR